MSVNEYFELGQKVGQLKNNIDKRFEKIAKDNILWGKDVDRAERQKLAEAMRLLFCIMVKVKRKQKKDCSDLTEVFEKALALWHETITK